MTRARFRLLYIVSSLLLVFSSAWNVRFALSAKIDAQKSGSLRPVISVNANTIAEPVLFRTQNRGFQLTACKKGRAQSLFSLLLLFLQAAFFATLLPHTAFALLRAAVISAVFNKYKSVITYLQTLI